MSLDLIKRGTKAGFSLDELASIKVENIETAMGLLKDGQPKEDVLRFFKSQGSTVSTKKTEKGQRGMKSQPMSASTLASIIDFGSIKAQVVEYKGRLAIKNQGVNPWGNGLWLTVSDNEYRIDPILGYSTAKANVAAFHEHVKVLEATMDAFQAMATELGLTVEQ